MNMNIIPFNKNNVYDLGVKDSNGNTVTSNCKVKCTRDQASKCKLFRMFPEVAYIILEITVNENFLHLHIVHKYYKHDDTPAYIQMYDGPTDNGCEYPFGDMKDVKYFAKNGTVLD